MENVFLTLVTCMIMTSIAHFMPSKNKISMYKYVLCIYSFTPNSRICFVFFILNQFTLLMFSSSRHLRFLLQAQLLFRELHFFVFLIDVFLNKFRLYQSWTVQDNLPDFVAQPVTGSPETASANQWKKDLMPTNYEELCFGEHLKLRYIVRKCEDHRV